jgi:hypothetical protein
MERAMRSRPILLLPFLLAAACGGGNEGPSQPTAPAAAGGPSRTVLVSGASFALDPGTATYKNIDLPPAGTLDATVDWAGANDINVYVTDNVCPGFLDLRAGRCNVIARSEGTAKPERLSWNTSTAAGRIWSIWIYNNGTSPESGAMEVGVTTAQPIPPAAAPTPAPASGGDPRDSLAAGPIVRYTIKVRSIDLGGFDYRDPFQNADGQWVVHPNEFIVFDSTQKNANGELCKWEAPPRWFLEDSSGVLETRESSQPFLFRADVRRKGSFRLFARIDGVESNALEVVSIR